MKPDPSYALVLYTFGHLENGEEVRDLVTKDPRLMPLAEKAFQIISEIVAEHGILKMVCPSCDKPEEIQ